MLLLLALAFVVACGGSDDHSPTNESTELPPRTDEPTQADETELARELLLRVSDFPAGWAEEEGDAEESPLDECDPNEAQGKTGEAESGDFSDGSDFTVSHHVAIFASLEDVSAAYNRIEEVAECFIGKINAGEADDQAVEASDASFSPLSFPQKGDESRAYRLKFHVKAKGESGLGSEGDVFFDIVYANVGRVGIAVSAFDTFSAPDPERWEPYVDIAIERARTGAD
jgi:hypothetical protein